MVDKSLEKISFGSLFYNRNVDLFLRRYPEYTFFLPPPKKLFSKEKVYLNGKLFQKHQGWFGNLKNADNTEIFYVYGIYSGASYLFLKRWLKKDPVRNLVYIEDDPERLSLFLASSIAKTILSDPSVHLFFRLPFENETLFLDRCCSNFFSGKIEVVPSVSITDPQKKNFEDLRSTLFRCATYYRASHIDDLYSFLNFSHFYKNIEKLPQSFHLNSLKDKFKNIPAVICGAGPSLFAEKENLKKIQNRALIIAGGSAIPALLSYGIQPHLGVVLDPNQEEAGRMKNAKKIDIPIAYSTRVHSGVFKYFKGPLAYISSVGGGLEGLFLDDKLKIKKDFVMGQNLSREALSVSTINLEVANFLGCSPIILCGIDLAYKDNKRYSPGASKKDNKVLVKDDDPGDTLLTEFQKTSEKVLTSIKWIMEKDVISSYKKDLGLDIINTSSTGLKIEGVDYRPFQEVVDTLFLESYCGKGKSVRDLLNIELVKAPVNVSSEDISNLKVELKESLAASKILISKIKKEVASLKKSKSQKATTSLMILYQKELEEELAYRYFLSRPKKAILRHLDNFYKISYVNLSSKEKISFLYKLWDNFQKIASKYIESTD